MQKMNEKIDALVKSEAQSATIGKIAEIKQMEEVRLIEEVQSVEGIQQTGEVQPIPEFHEPPDRYPKVYQMPEIRPRTDGLIGSKEESIPEAGPERTYPDPYPESEQTYPGQTYPEPAIPKIECQPAAVIDESPGRIEYQPAVVRDESPGRPEASTAPDKRNLLEKLPLTNWISKVGIITLVLGIGFFVKYAIDQNWINEVGRVGIGLLTGGIIIGIAHKLRTAYRVFSTLLAGGGIAVFYITLTLAFREYALFGQTLAFVLLIVTTLFSVLLSLLYDRKDLAVFSLLGCFASPLMVSTGMGSYVVLFSYIFILNTGMLIVSYRKQWRIIGMISFLLTLSFFGVWLFNQFDAITGQKPYFNLSLFVSLFYLQFYLLALLDHVKSGKKITAYQGLLILTNNLFAFLGFLYILNDYSLNIRGLITLTLAVINAIVLVVLFKNKRIDRNLIYLVVAIVLSFVSLAIPIQLKGHVITLFWAAETVVLLWLWQKAQIKVFYIGFILILGLTLCSYCMDINKLNAHAQLLPIVANRLFITGVFVTVALAVNLLLLKRESGKRQVSKALELTIIALAYIVPMIELDIQLARYTDNFISGTASFRYASLAVFTTVYIAVLSLIYRKKISSNPFIFGLFYSSLILFAVFFSILTTELRYDIFRSPSVTYPVYYFAVHLVALPAVACIIYWMIKNLKSASKHSDWLGWLLTVIVVTILSVETDHIVVWISANSTNYDRILHDVHTFGYPILWGVIAMILMIWGLNRKEAILRKISLVFFGLIIVKFYAYDVWNMSQFGRVISFVLLGVILLLVSFLQQKIRTLVKDNEQDNEIKQ
jgi:uncharacterized membrane protein